MPSRPGLDNASSSGANGIGVSGAAYSVGDPVLLSYIAANLGMCAFYLVG